VLKNTSRLQLSEPELKLDTLDAEDIELEVIKKFESTNKSKFNKLIQSLIKTLQIEKIDDEKSSIFEERLFLESKKVIGL